VGRWVIVSYRGKGLGGDDHQRGFRVKSPQRIRKCAPIDVDTKWAARPVNDRATRLTPSQAPDFRAADTDIDQIGDFAAADFVGRNCRIGRRV